MKVQLKGVHAVKRRLADGSKKTYYYAWRGGPRLDGEPGSVSFMDSFRSAMAERDPANQRKGTVAGLIDLYLASSEFAKRADGTKREYRRHLTRIESEFGKLPYRIIEDRRFRMEAIAWRDKRAHVPRDADAGWKMLTTLLSFGVSRNLIEKNVCTKVAPLYEVDRTEIIWSEEQISAVLKTAPQPIGDALIFALWTGQRQADVLGWEWEGYTGTHLRKRTNKKGAFVSIPVEGPLQAMLERRRAAWEAAEGEDRAPTILTNGRGRPWTGSGFRTSWLKAVRAAKVEDRHFHDLRGTAVTRLALAGCSEAQIASITGHSLSSVSYILEHHYLGGRAQLADQAMKRLADWYGSGAK